MFFVQFSFEMEAGYSPQLDDVAVMGGCLVMQTHIGCDLSPTTRRMLRVYLTIRLVALAIPISNAQSRASLAPSSTA